MGKRRGENKEKAREERKSVKRLVEEAFNHFGNKKLYKEQFIKYFLNKGMSKDEVDKLWIEADRMNIISIGVKPIVREEEPLKILGHVTIFRLKGKEDE